ncbi:DUF4870 domain-containing protein [Bacillus suaedaesalsae]|uniref:DUF4870 domain-containing protein n=1 Tax=Bacillus suaedaesalsae TaxID=2810349 RepID=A0ABS2DNF1_9BACI|nr:DUF4870 domain-containing protein [Bacillus suaedaesalsae]MBM6619031.1 DUF4870 domain-containing protein [Bacillus suaedaesalsae]
MKSDTNKLISALCYFSVFFAGFILPIAVYFIVDDLEVKRHAKHAFISHLIPLVTIPIFVFGGLLSGIGDGMSIVIILGFIVTFIVNIIVAIWNVVKGIQVLRTY